METSLILADYAQVWQGKLFITGGAVTTVSVVTPNPPFLLDLYAAAVVRVPWEAHNQPHRLSIGLSIESEAIALANTGALELPADEQGRFVAQFNAGRGPGMRPGSDTIMPVAVPLRVPVDKLGVYEVRVSVDGTLTARLEFDLMFPTTQIGAVPG